MLFVQEDIIIIVCIILNINEKVKNQILKKAAILALAKAGAPIGIEDAIMARAKEYLPANYSVEVSVVE